MRKTMSFILTLVLIFSLAVPGLAVEDAVSVAIDGSTIEFTEASGAPFIDDNDRTLVPLRITMESYGCQVYWDNENRKAIVYKDGVSVVCPIGENYIEVNGKKIDIDTSAEIVNDRTYLPIRFVLEAFGAQVGWEAVRHTVTIARGVTDAALHQEDKLKMALDAINSNQSLDARDSAAAKRAVTEYLSNIDVDNEQIQKMCSRLKKMTVEQGAMTDFAGYITTYDSETFVISINTLGEYAITDDETYYFVMLHELCHMFSEIAKTSRWFQEGMTQMFEIDMTSQSPLFSGGYDIYYQVIAALCDVLGTDEMLQAYLSGREDLIYAQLDLYAGSTNSKSLFNNDVESMAIAMNGSVLAAVNGGTYDGLVKNDWDALYAESAERISARISEAYKGKYGKDINSNPLMTMHLSIINNCSFFGTSFIISQPTLADKEDFCYYNRSKLKYFFVMTDNENAFCNDGELVYYRYTA